ncbi:putative nuclease HARBI1 [Aedes albopictus]|uniref:DDE Tnp4 domain-containing protein n=1 Tax=Aedes albopictus TaxID=7160 RepID=A0ABM1YSZ0_AEDAL
MTYFRFLAPKRDDFCSRTDEEFPAIAEPPEADGSVSISVREARGPSSGRIPHAGSSIVQHSRIIRQNRHRIAKPVGSSTLAAGHRLLFSKPTTSRFIKSFRVSKDIFIYLLDIIDENLVPSHQSTAVASMIMLAASLRVFTQGKYQKGVGNDRYIGLAQPTMSKVLQLVLDIIERHVCPFVIRFPTKEHEKHEIKLGFYEKTGYPGVIGCIDGNGTHISIITPPHDKHLFFNRKGCHSLNVMLVCDHNLMIRYLDANHPGSSHDSFVWNGSFLNQLLQQNYENGERNSWLLGDAGYSLTPFLITSFRTGGNITERETRFNGMHSKTRITVERSIGVAKNTFQCLLKERQLYYKPAQVTQIINVCIALQYLRIKPVMDLSDEEDVEFQGIGENHENAVRIREEIMNNIL